MTISRLLQTASVLLVLAGTKSDAVAEFYFDQGAFNSAIAGASFHTNLNSFNVGVVATPYFISSSGLSVDVTAEGLGELYSFGNELATSDQGDFLSFTNFSPGITAFGGFFYPISEVDGSFVATNISFVVQFAGTNSASTNVSAVNINNYIGILSSSDILSVKVSSEGSSLPATSQITIGTAVPEPSTAALFGLSLLAMAACAIRRRFRGTRPA